MSKLIVALTAGFLAAAPLSQAFAANAAKAAATVPAAGVPSGGQLEKELQGLTWKQFKSVVTAIPKLKADVDAYGPLGWQYVQANYKTYGWRKNIDKLDAAQKLQLAQLIRKSKTGAGAAN